MFVWVHAYAVSKLVLLNMHHPPKVFAWNEWMKICGKSLNQGSHVIKVDHSTCIYVPIPKVKHTYARHTISIQGEPGTVTDTKVRAISVDAALCTQVKSWQRTLIYIWKWWENQQCLSEKSFSSKSTDWTALHLSLCTLLIMCLCRAPHFSFLQFKRVFSLPSKKFWRALALLLFF